MKPHRTGYYRYMGERVLVLRNDFDGLYFIWDDNKKLVEDTKSTDWT